MGKDNNNYVGVVAMTDWDVKRNAYKIGEWLDEELGVSLFVEMWYLGRDSKEGEDYSTEKLVEVIRGWEKAKKVRFVWAEGKVGMTIMTREGR